MNRENTPYTAYSSLIRKGFSAAFRYAIPGIVAIMLLKLALPALYLSIAATLNIHVTAWALATVGIGMIVYSVHKASLFLFDIIILFRTKLTAVEVFREGVTRCDSIGPWILFLLHKYKEDNVNQRLLDYFSFRWSMGHSMMTIGEIGLFFTCVARSGSPLELHKSESYWFFGGFFILGLVTLIALYWSERRLYQKIK
jgi:hypothetical protein